MRVDGIVTMVVVGVVAVVAVVVGARSAPDVKRYLRMRQMCQM